MKVRTEKIFVIGGGLCSLVLLYVYLFFAFGPRNEEVSIWMPKNYDIQNITPDNKIIPMFHEPNANRNVLFSSIQNFKKLAGEEKVDVLIAQSNVVYYTLKIKNDFVIEASAYPDNYKPNLLPDLLPESTRFNQKTGILSLVYARSWVTISTICGGFSLVYAVVALQWYSPKYKR